MDNEQQLKLCERDRDLEAGEDEPLEIDDNWFDDYDEEEIYE